MNTKFATRLGRAVLILTAGALMGVASKAAAHDSKPFIDNFSTVTQGTSSAPTAGF